MVHQKPNEAQSESQITTKRGQSVPSFAEELGIGRATAWRAIRDGHLEAVRIGRRTLILAEAKERYLANLPRVNVRRAA